MPTLVRFSGYFGALLLMIPEWRLQTAMTTTHQVGWNDTAVSVLWMLLLLWLTRAFKVWLLLMLKNACGGARGLNWIHFHAVLERLWTNSLLKNSSTESLNRPGLFNYAGRALNMIKGFDTFLGTRSAINHRRRSLRC